MLPKNSADYRTLLWVALAAVFVGVQLVGADAAYMPALTMVNAYLALSCGVIAHNHNHCPVFPNRRMNDIFGNVLTVFYGYPTFAWAPTHNQNHHKHVNRAGDATITWRYSRRHNALVAATYFFVSSYWQSYPIREYIRQAKARNPRRYRKIVTQYVVWIGSWLALLATAIFLHGWLWGGVVWLAAVGIPALCSLWGIMFFNYEQHVHTDPWSEYNHSRNFTGRLVNFLLFNNGYHAIHHEHPALHWSELPAAHARIAAHIEPALKVGNLPLFLIRQFLLAPFWPGLGTRQVGRAPYDVETAGSTASLQ